MSQNSRLFIWTQKTLMTWFLHEESLSGTDPLFIFHIFNSAWFGSAHNYYFRKYYGHHITVWFALLNTMIAEYRGLEISGLESSVFIRGEHWQSCWALGLLVSIYRSKLIIGFLSFLFWNNFGLQENGPECCIAHSLTSFPNVDRNLA